MKLEGDYREWRVSQTQMAAILSLAKSRISQLVTEQILVRDEGSGSLFLIESLQNYYQSKQSSGKRVNFWDERALHERAKRQITELKLKQAKGEVYAAALVEQVMSEQLNNFKNKLLGVPAKMAAQLEGKTRAEINDALNFEIENLLEELSAGYGAAKLNDEIREIESSDAEESEAAEEDDG